LIADDHPAFRIGLRNLVEQIAGIEVCGEAQSGLETIRLVRLHHPNAVLIDLQFPDVDGLLVLRELHSEFPETDAIVVSMHTDETVVNEALSAGARGYIVKSDAVEAYRRALARVRSGFTFMSEELSHNVEGVSAGGNVRTSHPVFGTPLSMRETEVLRLLAQGNSNKQVAYTLGISPRTAEVHRGHLMKKLNVSSFSALVKYALRNKIAD
jgi:DNA-binding NarL/FixJ family response regulator